MPSGNPNMGANTTRSTGGASQAGTSRPAGSSNVGASGMGGYQSGPVGPALSGGPGRSPTSMGGRATSSSAGPTGGSGGGGSGNNIGYTGGGPTGGGGGYHGPRSEGPGTTTTTGDRGPIGGDGRPRTNYVGTGGNQAVASGLGRTTGSFDPYAAGRRGMYANQQRFQTDTYRSLGAKQPNLNPIFSGKLFGGLVAANNLGIPLGESPFGYDTDTLGRTPEQAAQNKANALQRAFTFNGKTYRPNKGKIMAAGPYTSPHVYGLAADIEAGALRDYLKENAGILGLETIRGDAPHVQLAGTRAASKSKGGLRSQYAQVQQGQPASAVTASLQPNTQMASLGPIAMSAPRISNPPIPQRNPMRTGIPTPQPKPIGPQIASLGAPVPQMAPGGFFPGEIDQARTARPAPPQTFAGSGQPSYSAPRPSEPNPMTSSTPATMVDYNRVIAALEQSNARQRQATAPLGPSAPNADMIARAYSEDARVNERRYDAPDLAFRALNTPEPTTLSAPQMHPDRRQELTSRRLPSQPLLNTRSATAVEGPRPVASYPSNLSGSPPTRSPYYSQGDMSEAEAYAGPFDPRMGTDQVIDGLPAPDPISDQTQYQSPAAPPISTLPPSINALPDAAKYHTSPPEFDAPLNYMRDRYQRQRNAPKVHEIQEPGQVPGMPSRIANMEQGIDNAAKTARDIMNSNWWRGTAKRNDEALSLRNKFRGGENREVSRLARVLRRQGEADSQREARELAKNLLDYSRITYS